MTRELWVMEVERDHQGKVTGQPVAIGKASGEVVDDVLALLTEPDHGPVTLARDTEQPHDHEWVECATPEHPHQVVCAVEGCAVVEDRP